MSEKITDQRLAEIQARADAIASGIELLSPSFQASYADIPDLLNEVRRLEADKQWLKKQFATVDNANKSLESDNYNLDMNLTHVSEQLAAVTRERDAAEKDLRHDCGTCKHPFNPAVKESPCIGCVGSCVSWHATKNNWEWRGLTAATAPEGAGSEGEHA